jgi:hypothetical protein
LSCVLGSTSTTETLFTRGITRKDAARSLSFRSAAKKTSPVWPRFSFPSLCAWMHSTIVSACSCSDPTRGLHTVTTLFRPTCLRLLLLVRFPEDIPTLTRVSAARRVDGAACDGNVAETSYTWGHSRVCILDVYRQQQQQPLKAASLQLHAESLKISAHDKNDHFLFRKKRSGLHISLYYFTRISPFSVRIQRSRNGCDRSWLLHTCTPASRSGRLGGTIALYLPTPPVSTPFPVAPIHCLS